jgi:hypothetical protein
MFETRPIAARVAVCCFFLFSFLCWLTNQSPLFCCKRALAGAVLAYIAAAAAVKAVNAIITQALIDRELTRQKEDEIAAEN